MQAAPGGSASMPVVIEVVLQEQDLKNEKTH
jgi:hypothetical protein